jgi:hypothetical protein
MILLPIRKKASINGVKKDPVGHSFLIPEQYVVAGFISIKVKRLDQ